VPLFTGIYQISTKQIYIAAGLERFASIFYLANAYAIFLLIVLVSSIPLVFILKNKKQKCLIILMLLMLFEIVILKVRAVWVSLFFVFIIIYWFLPEIRKYLAVIFLTMLLISSSIFARGFKTVIDPNTSKGGHGDTIYLRMYLWKQYVKNAFVEKPILGFGVGTTAGPLDKSKKYLGLLPHCDYLRALVETGIVGFIPFLLFFLIMLRDLYRDIYTYEGNKLLNVCAFANLSTIAINLLVGNQFYFTIMMWYLFSYLGLTHKLNYLSTQKSITVKNNSKFSMKQYNYYPYNQ
jgi:O-antigen ligase